MRLWKASTPPRITAISPGNRMPTKADASRAGTKNTTDSATQPCRDKMSSAARLIVVGGAVGLRSRAWPGSKTPSRHGNGTPTPNGCGCRMAAAVPTRLDYHAPSFCWHDAVTTRVLAVAVDGSDGGEGAWSLPGDTADGRPGRRRYHLG